MNGSEVVGLKRRKKFLNAVPLQNAVLCAECDVVSDSPHDVCMVCGSRSLFNIARVFGGRLPNSRANLIAREEVAIASREVVLPFPKPHRVRRRATAGSGQGTLISFGETKTGGVRGEELLAPKSR
jgi:hypothetical protein